MAEVYYLNWDRKRGQKKSPEQRFFSRAHGLTDEIEAVPKEYYRDMGSVDVNADSEESLLAEVEGVYQGWQAGVGEDSEVFASLRVCPTCLEQFESEAKGEEHNEMVHGGSVEMMGVRSMSVGDVIEIEGTPYIVASLGFNEIEWSGDGAVHCSDDDVLEVE